MPTIQEKIKRTLGKKDPLKDSKLDYLDIGKLVEEKEIELPPLLFVKVATLSHISHLDEYLNFVRDGNILILDPGVVGNDDETMEELGIKLKELVREVDGDLAGISPKLNHIVITPGRVKIDRKRLMV